MRKTLGLLGDDRGLDRELLAIGPFPPGIEHAEHGIADGEIGATARRADHAGKVTPRNLRKLDPGVPGILAGAEFPVGSVNAGCDNIDNHLARPRHRIRQVAVFQHIGAAELFNKCSFHLSPYLPIHRYFTPQPRGRRPFDAPAADPIGTKVDLPRLAAQER